MRNPSIEALRFLFMVQICIWHNSSGFGTMQAGFLGVEFFFILSGIFLYRTAVRPGAPGIIGYSVGKLSKFYPAYVAVCVLSYIAFAKNGIVAFAHAPVETSLKFIGQLLLIQGTGVGFPGVNNALWFFSVLVWGGALVYSLVRYYPALSIRVLFPTLCLLFFAYIFNHGEGPGFERWTSGGFPPVSIDRGVAEIAFGVLVGYLIFNYGTQLKSRRRLLDAAALLSVVLYIPIIFAAPAAQPYVLVLFPVILASAMTEGSLIQRCLGSRFWLPLGRLSFDMYLIHLIVIHLVGKGGGYVGLSQTWLNIAYLVLLVPGAWLFRQAVSLAVSRLKTTAGSQHRA